MNSKSELEAKLNEFARSLAASLRLEVGVRVQVVDRLNNQTTYGRIFGDWGRGDLTIEVSTEFEGDLRRIVVHEIVHAKLWLLQIAAGVSSLTDELFERAVTDLSNFLYSLLCRSTTGS
ncbi:MAG: hypothetical protein QXI02_02120 [Candidatus Caldarchaeum sp.]